MAHAANLLMQHLAALVDPARQETALDGELLTRWAKDRDGQAFSALVWRYGPLVWRVSRGVLAHKEDAEDAFQATFLVLARKAAALKQRASVAGWLYQTAFRLALNSRKASARRRRREAQIGAQAGTDPMEELSVREARTILTEEVQRLPAEFRDPIVLCLYEGATQDEAARQLDCALSTLKRRLESGRGLLARRLTSRGLVPAVALALTLSSRSTVSGRLVMATIAAAKEFVLGQTLTGGVAAMAGGMLRAVLLKKLAVCLTVLLAVGGLTLGAGFVYLPRPQSPQAKGPPAPTQAKAVEDPPPAPRLDRHGDPLPSGAVNRLGSLRFRNGVSVESLVYTPDGKAIVSACADGSVRLWDAATGKLLWDLKSNKAEYYHHALAFSDDGKKLARLSNLRYVVVETGSNNVLVHHQWPLNQDAVENATCGAIAPGLATFACGFLDCTVRIYDAATGQESQRITVGEKAQSEIPQSIELSADGKTVYVLANRKPGITAFDAKTGTLLHTLNADDQILRPKMAFSKDFKQLAVFGFFPEAKPGDGPDGRVVLWDLKSGKQRHAIKLRFGVSGGAFSPDGKLFAVSGLDNTLFDTATGKEQRRLPGLGGTAFAFHPDGITLAAGDDAGVITRWNIATGELKEPLPEPKGPSWGTFFRADGKQLLTFGWGSVYWWDVAGGQSIRHLQETFLTFPGGRPVSLDERTLVTREENGDLVLKDISAKLPPRSLQGHKSLVKNVAFSPDAALLYSAGGFDPRVILWDVASGKPLKVLESHKAYVDHVAPSPDGRWLASWAADATAEADYDIRLWDVATCKLLHRLTPRRGSAFAAVFSADSTRLATVGGDPGRLNISGEVQLWDVATGKELRSFAGHQERVRCVALSPDGRMIATGSLDKTLRLWEVASGTERGRIHGHNTRVHSVDFSPQGRLLAATSNDAPILIWDVYALENSKLTASALTKSDKDNLWQQLSSDDAPKAFRAICDLIARPNEAVPLLQDGWKAIPRATTQQMQHWIDELDSDQFSVRQKAQAELERYLAGHELLLAKALDKTNTLELRRRLEGILNRLHPERLRRTRLLEVLERIGTGPARQFLQMLAAQTEDAEMAREAATGLKRLER
jgi:RNA polymerase sigma factor (sigma-70 family)